MERRDLEENSEITFLWCDESQYFINPNYDTMFQTTARSSLVCTVYLTQSLNNYIYTMGSRSPMARAKGLMANMATKIFHANSDFETNDWASKMIGQEIDTRDSQGRGDIAVSDQLVNKVPSHKFSELRFGRRENKEIVEAVIHTTGKWQEAESSYLRVEFEQD